MGEIVGTDGDDNLIGTKGNDVFRTLLGRDVVDGSTGEDALIVDYSIKPSQQNRKPSYINWNMVSYSGEIASGVSDDSVRFSNIEVVIARLAGLDDVMYLSVGRKIGSMLVLDGGGGRDLLAFTEAVGYFDFDASDPSRVVTDRPWFFSNFERYLLTLGEGKNNVITGADDDLVRAGLGINNIKTGAGNDVILSTGGLDVIDGGSGYDSWVIDLKNSTADGKLLYTGDTTTGLLAPASGGPESSVYAVEHIVAEFGSGADVISVSNARGSLNSGKGDDTVSISGASILTLNGGEGKDKLTVDLRDMSSQLHLSAAYNNVTGYSGKVGDITFEQFETMIFQLGDADSVVAVDGEALASKASIIVSAGGGNDRLQLDFTHVTALRLSVDTKALVYGNSLFTGFDAYEIKGGAAGDIITGSPDKRNDLYGGSGNDALTGGSDRDLILGEDGNDRITAGAGDDFIQGGNGNDGLSAGIGNDLVVGGMGLDRLTGGAGADLFVLDVLETSANRDVIVDFEVGEDKIGIARSAFRALDALPQGSLDPSMIAFGTKALTADQHLIYNAQTGNLFYDPDGSGAAAQIHLAAFINKPVLTAESFVVL